jgi:hypothetical protein
MVTAGLMFLAVLMLSAAQVPLGESDHAHHAHAAHHHLGASTPDGSASAPCSNHCDHHGHVLGCCMASCTVASVSLLTDPHKAKPHSDITVAYHAAASDSSAAASDSSIGVVPDRALRPSERIG